MLEEGFWHGRGWCASLTFCLQCKFLSGPTKQTGRHRWRQPVERNLVGSLLDQLAAGPDHCQLDKLRTGVVARAEGDAVAAEVLVDAFQGGNQLLPGQVLGARLADSFHRQLGNDEAFHAHVRVRALLADEMLDRKSVV